jgi:hypothetical protein
MLLLLLLLQDLPEMRRVPLVDVCLLVKAWESTPLSDT